MFRVEMVKPKRFYTYAYLREDKTPYYVGKGSGKRLYVNQNRVISPPKDKSRIIFLKQNLTEEEAFRHEIYMIAVFGRKDLGTGILHNKTDGGDGVSGLIHSLETRAKLSVTNKGKTLSLETRAKLSATNKGKTLSPETRAKMSAAKKNIEPETRAKMSAAKKNIEPETRAKMSAAKKGENNPNYGKKGKTPSLETRAKLSAAMKGENNPNYGKTPSPETRAKLSAANKGKTHSPEAKAKMSAAKKRERVL